MTSPDPDIERLVDELLAMGPETLESFVLLANDFLADYHRDYPERKIINTDYEDREN